MYEHDIMITPIGELAILETYIEYDGPRLFLCRNHSDQMYIGLWAQEEEEADIWLFVPVSEARRRIIRIGYIPLREAIQRAEDGWVWLVRMPYDESQPCAKQLLVDDIEETHLPDPDARLELPDDELPRALRDPIQRATQTLRDQLLFALDGHNHIHEIDADALGLVLHRGQELVHSLGHKGGATKGRIPHRSQRKTQLRVTGVEAASFGVRLESAELAGTLFPISPAEESLSTLLSVFDAGSNRGQLKDLLAKIGPRAVLKYHSFLKALSAAGLSLDVSWASPAKKQAKARLGIETIRDAIAILEEDGSELVETFEVYGRLVGNIWDKGRFEFLTDDDIRYKGRVAEPLRDQTFTLPMRGRAIIEETIEINPSTGAEKSSYVLQALARDGV